MNDRYLFRAKRLDNGEWEVGSLICVPNWEYEIANKCTNPPDSDPMWGKCVITHKVDQSTICQCTGLKDKNGKLIWENDVVKCSYNYYGEKGVYIGKVIYREDTCYFIAANNKSTDYEWWEEEKEIIGNIFDNPELMHE